jgi:hypothetical protein
MTDDRFSNISTRVSYFLPLLVPILIVIAFVGFYRLFLFCKGPDAPCSLITTTVLRAGVRSGNDTQVRSYVAKATWTLVNGVHVIACLAALIISGVVMNRALSDYDRLKRTILISLAIAVAAAGSLWVSVFFNNDTGSPGPQLLRSTVGQVLPACAILWNPKPDEPEDPARLKKRLRLLRFVLFTSAAMLVISVFRLSTTLNWGASFIPSDGEVGKFIGPLVSGIVSSLGTFYTLLIAGMYFPAMLLLRNRVNDLAEAPGAPATFLTDNNLNPSVSAWLPRIVAILAPLMAGPFIDLLKTLTGTVI